MPVATVLYLDADFKTPLAQGNLDNKRILLIPEIGTQVSFEFGAQMPNGLTVDFTRILNPTGNFHSVYNPTPDLLTKISALTLSREVDIVVIGNNLGAGVKKAKAVAARLRARTIITANGNVNQDDYLPLGYSRFVSRLSLHEELLKLLNE